MLEELNDEFVRRLDKKSYGGERFVRVIERSLGQRVHELRRNDEGRRERGRDRRIDNGRR